MEDSLLLVRILKSVMVLVMAGAGVAIFGELVAMARGASRASKGKAGSE